MRPMGSAKTLEKRRRRAIELLKEGMSQIKVGQEVGSSQSSVSRWAKLVSEGTGLSGKPHPGRKRRLNAEEHRALESSLAKGAVAHGWGNDLWTSRRVKELIERMFGISYHPDHVRKILVYQLGWTAQVPSMRARERDEDAIEHWRKEEFPRLKKTR
jgi:transposase